ncbi:MAG: phosphotransferase, partial [Selenomonadaceae bacterium]|nr:phosphotransferase [Selenomonadaceae bacterium]
ILVPFCEQLFHNLLLAVEDMHAHRPQCDRRTAQAAVRSMCVDKTIQRLDKLRLNDDFKNFFTQKVIVNGKTFRSLDEILALLPAQVERLLFENVEEYFSVIHGDLCLPNILVEEEHKFLRLVDPRGKFGDFDIYGDWRYDLAKMLHSLEGNYDFIIADKFKVNVQGAAIDYEFALDFAQIREKFFEVFAGQLKNLPALRLIEATLFLSMIPLHADSLSRQQVMLARGVELFEAVMEEPK